MKVITLWQPWASFVALGWKTIETRTHNRFKNLVDETIGIHAGNVWDKDWKGLAGDYLTDVQLNEIWRIKDAHDKGYERGGILCTAKVERACWLASNHSQPALIECNIVEGCYRFGLFLADVKPIQLIPAKGKQGIWNIDLKPEEVVYL